MLVFVCVVGCVVFVGVMGVGVGCCIGVGVGVGVGCVFVFGKLGVVDIDGVC